VYDKDYVHGYDAYFFLTQVLHLKASLYTAYALISQARQGRISSAFGKQ